MYVDHEMSPNQRMLTVAIYLAVVMDYLQHMEEYDARANHSHAQHGALPQGVERQCAVGGPEGLHPKCQDWEGRAYSEA